MTTIHEFPPQERVRVGLLIMKLRIIVLAKQVPDTRNVGKDAMNADGTIKPVAFPLGYTPI